uniref:Putative secreted protein n=1 Tax=Ixodes ricinus TaxID=34613 RepID=A0A6B0UMA5_IXORI
MTDIVSKVWLICCMTCRAAGVFGLYSICPRRIGFRNPHMMGPPLRRITCSYPRRQNWPVTIVRSHWSTQNFTKLALLTVRWTIILVHYSIKVLLINHRDFHQRVVFINSAIFCYSKL